MSLQQAVQQRFGVRASIKTGKPGDMSVLVDGKSVFGYKQEGGRMPAIDELLRRVEALQTT